MVSSLLKKAYTSMTDDKLKEEVREFYKGHSAAIRSIVKESQDKVNYALSTYSELTILFQHNEESKTLLRNLIHTSNTSTTTASATKGIPKTKSTKVRTITPRLSTSIHKDEDASLPAGKDDGVTDIKGKQSVFGGDVSDNKSKEKTANDEGNRCDNKEKTAAGEDSTLGDGKSNNTPNTKDSKVGEGDASSSGGLTNDDNVDNHLADDTAVK